VSVVRDRHSDRLRNCGEQIYGLGERRNGLPVAWVPWVPDEQGYVGVTVVVGVLLTERAALAKVMTVVGGDYNYRLFPERDD
jgi:hypothetical protein